MTTTGDVTQGDGPGPVAAAAGLVLMTLASSQFLMTLDSSVMNVSMATVASDVGTDITGIQTAITLYTLVMATLMITGGKIGSIIGRRRAFAIGCVVYGAGSFTTTGSFRMSMPRAARSVVTTTCQRSSLNSCKTWAREPWLSPP